MKLLLATLFLASNSWGLGQQIGVVTTSQLADGAVTTSKLGAGAVTTSKIATGALEPLTLDAANGRVGVDFALPLAKLVVRGASALGFTSTDKGIFQVQSSADAIGLSVGTYANAPYGSWIQSGDPRSGQTSVYPLILQEDGGLVGISTIAPCSTCTLHVAGTANITGALRQGSLRSCATGTQTDADGLFSACVASDKSLKRDIHPYIIEFDAIDKLKPVAYRWIDANRDTRQHIGFVAQDVEKVLPSAVVSAGTDLKGIDSNALISALVLELQALRKRVAALEKR